MTDIELKTFEAKKAAARKIAASINKDLKKESPDSEDLVVIMGDRPDLMVKKYMSTGNPVIDRLLGGGIVLGVPIEIIGAPGCSKSTTTMMIARQFLLAGKLVAYVNVEQQAPPVDQIKAAGFTDEEIKDLIIIPAFGSGEKLFDTIKDFLLDYKTQRPNHIIDCVIIDSVAALAPSAEIASIDKNGFEGNTIGRHAAMVGKFLRQMCGTGAISREGSLILINQLRAQVSTVPMPDIGTGGRSIPYFAKTRLSFKKDNTESKKLVDKDGNQLGLAINVSVIKNNMGIPGRSATFRFIYGQGLDSITPIFEEALDYGIITKRTPTSPMYVFNTDEGQVEVKGLDAAKDYFKNNPALITRVTSEVELKRSSEMSNIPDLDSLGLDSIEEDVEFVDV